MITSGNQERYNLAKSKRIRPRFRNVSLRESPLPILHGLYSYTMELVSLALCSAFVFYIRLYELMMLVLIASRRIKPTELVSWKSGVKTFVNSLCAFRAGSVKNEKSTVWKLLYPAGTKGASGAQICSYRFLCYAVISFATCKDFIEVFVNRIQFNITTFI